MPVVSLAILSGASCTSQNNSAQPTSEDPATLACYDAGNSCGSIKGGCGTEGIQAGNCAGAIPCCRPALNCGQRICATGNTCDTSAPDYCPGTTSASPNCGSAACLGGCTCAANGTGCDCPPCQRQDTTGCNGSGGGVVYACLPGTDQQGNVINPPDAGSCTPKPGGFLCCEN